MTDFYGSPRDQMRRRRQAIRRGFILGFTIALAGAVCVAAVMLLW